MHHVRHRLVPLLLIVATLAPVISVGASVALAQSSRIEPQEVALRPTDLPPGFAVTKEESKPMEPGPGMLYAVTLDRPITNQSVSTGPVGVVQVIGRFDQSVSYEGFLDELRRQAIEQDGFELVPGAPNDGGTSSLQKFEGDVASFRVGFIKRDMVIFTGTVGRRGVVSLQGLLTLAGVSSNRYDEALVAKTGVTIPAQGAAPASEPSSGGSVESSGTTAQRGQIVNTGGTGANLRSLPQVNSDLVQVVQDGEAVELIGAEEKGLDGRAWRNVKTSKGMVGWVVSEYVSAESPAVAAAPAPAPAPPPPPTPTPMPAAPARVVPTPTPQSTGTIDSRIVPALRTLVGIRKGPSGGVPWGDWYRAVVDKSAVNIVVRPLPAGTGGSYAVRTNTLTIAQALLNEDVRIVATILAHELTHVAQSLRGMDGTGACVDREVEALQHELIVLVILFEGGAPGRTGWEREENARAIIWMNLGDPGLYRLVVETPGYQDQCKLWVP